MESFFQAVLHQPFLQHALLGGVLASIACGLVGTYVVVRRIGYMAGGIAHAVLGGMGIAYFLGKSPLSGAIVAALFTAIIIGWVSLHLHEQQDTIISALWAVGMAVGIIFITKSPGYNVDLMSFLFGNILMIPLQDLYFILGLDLVIVFTVLLFYKQLLAVSFDEEFARLRGVSVDFFTLLLLCLVALTVVILIQVVGLILVIALLTLPAAIAGQFARSLGHIMLLAILLGVIFTSGGLALSYGPDLPTGATTVLLAGLGYLIATLLRHVVGRIRPSFFSWL